MTHVNERNNTDFSGYSYVNRKQKCFKKKQLHCIDGPAVTWLDGKQEWYQNGLLNKSREIKLFAIKK
jgi:hypothetical protein